MSARRWVGEARRFAREYTAGVRPRDLKRLFDQEAGEAFAVITRDQPEERPTRSRVRRTIRRARALFLGVSYQLTPARRLLFAASLVAALFALLGGRFEVSSTGRQIVVDFSPFWFLAALGGLLFLLALELVDRVRVRDELEVARQLQRDLLPKTTPTLPGWSFAHSYRTANEVGGDYYDLRPLPEGRLAIVVGDASGHGMAAGLLMAIANATLITALDVDPDPSRVADLLNRTLVRTGDRRAFMTLFYGLLDPRSGRLDFVCAGHPFPLLRRRDGRIMELGRGSLPLGIRADLTLHAESVELAPGELLVLYSDGLPEAVGAEGGRSFGFGTISDLVAAGCGASGVHDRVLAAFDRHLGDARLHDDLTLVVVEHQAAPAR